MLRRSFLLLVIALACPACDRPASRSVSAGTQYVASSQREPFHRLSCEWAAEIHVSNLQEFATREDAIAAGHRACKVCKP